MRVMGRTPRCLLRRISARTPPAPFARSNALDQGLSIRYPSFVKTDVHLLARLLQVENFPH